MTYEQAVRYLAETIGFGINPGLERIQELCRRLKHPERAYPVIQITGTNGKTTTARAITAILHAHGLDVGTYTSPHLTYYTERISVNGRAIPKAEFGRRLQALLSVIDKVDRKLGPTKCTHFEILTALALEYFRDRKVDAVVTEVGMGGRWDATSVAPPEVGVFTNVGLEHTDRLGRTVEKIAVEKSYIIKKGTQAVVGPVPRRVVDILCTRAVEVGGCAYFLGRDFDFKELPAEGRSRTTGVHGGLSSGDKTTQVMDVGGLMGGYQGVRVPLGGDYQLENLTLAIVACELLLERPLDQRRVSRAVARLTSPGRLEVVRARPLTVLDGAHNPAALARLRQALARHFRFDRLIVVFSVLEDKDIAGMLEELSRAEPAAVVITSNVSERAADPAEVGALAARLGLPARVEPSIPAAIELATKEAAGRDLVCVTGSLYLVGPAREFFRK